MNERIRELWAQCVTKHTKSPMNWQDVADEFAELIISECAELEEKTQRIAELEKQVEELVGALIFAREQINNFPRSLAYDLTALPVIDKALAKHKKVCDHGKGLAEYCEPCGRINNA